MNQAKFWRRPQIQGVDLLQASYTTQSFTRHMHEEFAIGVIERGGLGFDYRGAHLIASKGSINLCNAGEFHTGKAVTEEGWSYRMFYIQPNLMAGIVAQANDSSPKIPFFKNGVVKDDFLAGQLIYLHRTLEADYYNDLEQQHFFLSTLLQFISRYAEDPPVSHKIGDENRRVSQICEYIDAFYSRNIRLDELSYLVELSPFHLTRVFRRHVGVPPHAYLNQVRVQKAKALLGQGMQIAHVAFETGFVDQSHLHRHFKQILGITPGQYRNSVARTYNIATR